MEWKSASANMPQTFVNFKSSEADIYFWGEFYETCSSPGQINILVCWCCVMGDKTKKYVHAGSLQDYWFNNYNALIVIWCIQRPSFLSSAHMNWLRETPTWLPWQWWVLCLMTQTWPQPSPHPADRVSPGERWHKKMVKIMLWAFHII